MKKLIYFYCEDLRGFEDTDFNFSSKYKIHFDKDTGILTINKGDENYIDNFYGENMELNAIIGNNGAGKSSLFKKIFKSLNIYREKIAIFDSFLMFEITTKNSSEIIIELSINPANFEIVNKWSSVKFPIVIKRNTDTLPSRCLYITQVLDKELYYLGDNINHNSNYSTFGMFDFTTKNNINLRYYTVIKQFFHFQFVNQVDFLSDKNLFSIWTKSNTM